jgi:hypothetical protein
MFVRFCGCVHVHVHVCMHMYISRSSYILDNGVMYACSAKCKFSYFLMRLLLSILSLLHPHFLS